MHCRDKENRSVRGRGDFEVFEKKQGRNSIMIGDAILLKQTLWPE